MVDPSLKSEFSDPSRSISEAVSLIYPSFRVHKDIGVKYAVFGRYMPFFDDRGLLSKISFAKGQSKLEHSIKRNIQNAWRQHVLLRGVKLGQAFTERALQLSPQMRDEIFEELCAKFPNTYFADEDDFLANREQLIEKYIEQNCRDLARFIMDHDFETTYSHGYGAGYKGVYWNDPYNVGSECFFTSIMNGKTYRAEQGVLGRPAIQSFEETIDPGVDFSEALPDGWNPNAILTREY